MKVMTNPESQGVMLLPLPGGLTLPARFPSVTAVPLPGGATVPARFPFVTTMDLDGRQVLVGGAVTMVDGRPRFDVVSVEPPLAPSEMRRVVTNRLLDKVVAGAASNTAGVGVDEAIEAAQRARYRRSTPEHLRDVLAVHATGGVKGVMRKFNYTERHARRLLARARKETKK
jgi:hypothetical protein